MAKALFRHGASVAILGRNKSKLDKAAQSILNESKNGSNVVIALPTDVRFYDQLEASFKTTFEKLGRIDYVVCGAAGNFLCAAEGLSPNAFKTVVEIDLIGTFK